MDFTSRTSTRITINGQTYSSVDDMPPDVRRQYEGVMAKLKEDRNNNGIPDFAEQPGVQSFITHTTHEVRGVSELPPDIRRQISHLIDDDSLGTTEPPHRGVTLRLALPTLIAMALIIAIVCAVAWSLLR